MNRPATSEAAGTHAHPCASRIGLWVALGGASWAAVAGVVLLAVRLLG